MTIRANALGVVLDPVLMTDQAEGARARHALQRQLRMTRGAPFMHHILIVRIARGPGMARHAAHRGLVMVCVAGGALQASRAARQWVCMALRACDSAVPAVVEAERPRARLSDRYQEAL